MNVPPTKRAARLSALAALAMLGAFAAACSNPYGELCERGAICRGANDLDIDACVIEQESRADVASIWGCDDQWNNYVDCMVDRGSCSGDKLSGCDDAKDQWKRCVE